MTRIAKYDSSWFMTPISFAVVGLRLLAVYSFIQSVPNLYAIGFVSSIPNLSSLGTDRLSVILAGLLPGVSLLILAVLLYYYSEPLARRLLSSHLIKQGEATAPSDDFQVLIFAAVGVLILTQALPGLGRAVQGLMTYYRDLNAQLPGQRATSNENWMYCAGVLAQFFIGLAMLFNPKGFRNAWRWLRTAGT